MDYYDDVIMGEMASQITSLTIVYSTIYSKRRSKKHQSSASLAFVRGIHQWPVNSLHKGPVTRKMFPFDDVTMSPHKGLHAVSVCAKFMVMNTFYSDYSNKSISKNFGYSWKIICDTSQGCLKCRWPSRGLILNDTWHVTNCPWTETEDDSRPETW